MRMHMGRKHAHLKVGGGSWARISALPACDVTMVSSVSTQPAHAAASSIQSQACRRVSTTILGKCSLGAVNVTQGSRLATVAPPANHGIQSGQEGMGRRARASIVLYPPEVKSYCFHTPPVPWHVTDRAWVRITRLPESVQTSSALRTRMQIHDSRSLNASMNGTWPRVLISHASIANVNHANCPHLTFTLGQAINVNCTKRSQQQLHQQQSGCTDTHL